MPRGDHKIDGRPYGIWVEKVERQNRIRLPSEIQDVVPWLKKHDTIDCIGSPGPVGGLQVEPFASYDHSASEFAAALSGAAATSSEAGDSWVEAARLLASTWRIKVSVESNRVNIPLSEPIRRVLPLPGAGGTVVVFGFGEILEVWEAVAWRDHVRTLASGKDTVVTEAIEAMAHR